MNAPYQAIRCADGYITLGAANERLFRRLCEVLGHPEWVHQPEFADNASRVANRERLAARIEEITATQPRRHWLALLEANDIPCGPINNYAQVFADPQVIAREMVVETEHPTLGRLEDPGLADQDERDAARCVAPRAAARRAHGRSAARGGLQRRRDRGAPPVRRGAVTTLG